MDIIDVGLELIRPRPAFISLQAIFRDKMQPTWLKRFPSAS